MGRGSTRYLAKGTRGGTQTQEYRVELAGGAKQTITYTAVYAW